MRLRLCNQGSAQALATTVRITFVNGGIVDVAAPTLGPGMETSGAANIPAGCIHTAYCVNSRNNIGVTGLAYRDQVLGLQVRYSF